VTRMADEKSSKDIQRIIAEVAARHKLVLKPDDAGMALVTMNQLMMETAIARMQKGIQETLSGFDASYHKAERRAGSVLAQEVKEAATQMREGLQGDIRSAGLKAREYVHLVNEAHRRPVRIRWAAAGVLGGAVLFACGVWLGILIH
jgi:hypothetical protein